MLKIGHRGAAGLAPENTIPSFEKAITLGVDMVEFDVQRCKTGELVIIHDPTIDRTTQKKGRIRQKTLAELQTLGIPTLDDVLRTAVPRVGVMIELKDDEISADTLHAIERFIPKDLRGPDRLWVVSFRHAELQRFHALAPDIAIGALYEHFVNPKNAVRASTLLRRFHVIRAKLRIGKPQGMKAAHAHAAGKTAFDAQAISIDCRSLTKRLMDDARLHGIKVFCFNADTPKSITKCKKLGVDGIISNFPDRL